MIVLHRLPFGIRIASGPLGFVLLIAADRRLGGRLLRASCSSSRSKTRSAAATNSAGLIFFPLLFLTPNFVPRDLLTRPMEIAATLNPVTYVMEAHALADPGRPRLGGHRQGLRRGGGVRRGDGGHQRPDDGQLRLSQWTARIVRA